MPAVRHDRSLITRTLFWGGALVLVTIVLLWARGNIDQSHVALTLLLVVLGGSAGGGRKLGFSLAVVSFLVIDYYFQPPYELITVAKSNDWIVLVAFVASAFVATELLNRARQEAETARRHDEAARELKQANRAKDEVLAAVSHDLRTPLTTIKLLAQRAAARGEPAAADIEDQADRLAKLVTNVLDLSRIRAGGIELEMELNTAEDLVGAAIQQVAGMTDGRRINAVVDLSLPALTARFDFVQTLRILGNLIDNALRYTPPGGCVDIETAVGEPWLVIRVADRGPGIAPSEQDRIFDAFYRPSTEAPDAGHAGLGLSIARQLAEMQGGRLGYAVRGGGGSIFTLQLPLAAE